MNIKYQISNIKYQINSLEIPTNRREGQAMITLLFFIVTSTLITSAAVMIIITNSISASKVEQANIALSIAESGMENAILRSLRNPTYSGETLTIGDGTALTSITGDTTKIATSEGRLGDFSRKIEARIEYTNNILTILSWEEIY